MGEVSKLFSRSFSSRHVGDRYSKHLLPLLWEGQQRGRKELSTLWELSGAGLLLERMPGEPLEERFVLTSLSLHTHKFITLLPSLGHKAECKKAQNLREDLSSEEVPLEGQPSVVPCCPLRPLKAHWTFTSLDLHDWEDENSNKLWIAGLHAFGLYDRSNWSRMVSLFQFPH